MNKLLREAYERLRIAEDKRTAVLPEALEALPALHKDWTEACFDLVEAKEHFHRIAYDYCREQYQNA